MCARGLSGVTKLARAECVHKNRLAECLQKASQVPETFLVEHTNTTAFTWVEQLECLAAVMESGKNVPRVSEASVSIALKRAQGDVFGEEERDGERERNGGQSGDFEREENIRGCFR